jgi:ABC-type ATPase with predicted acetyltransferase domain
MDQFQNAHDKSLLIHNNDIKKWTLKARAQVDLSLLLFTASTKWVHNFKKAHRIVSRKINKFVTQTQLANKDNLLQEANQFVSKVRKQISLLGTNNVHNSDQSNFNLEIHGGRTLSFKGNMKVECLAQSLNSLTHSYMIQSIVIASGLLKSPLFIVLQETGGKFGPLVEKHTYKAKNIIVLPSVSGKLTSQIAVQCYKDIYLSNVSERSVLCLDSWSGQTKKILTIYTQTARP